MKIKFNKISNFFYYIYFTLILLSGTIPSFSNFYANYSLIIQSLLLFALFVFNAKKVIKETESFMLIILILTISSISIVFSEGGVGSFLNLFHFLVGILIFLNIEINKKMKRFLYVICILLWIFNIRLSFSAWKLHVMHDSIYNPNSIGIFIFMTVIIIKSFLKEQNNRLLNIFSVFLILFSTYCIYLTNCRSALLAMIVYIICLYIPLFNKLVFRYKKILICLIVIVGTIFPIIYVNMYKNKISLEIPFIKKSLYTGREKLWISMLDSLNDEKYGHLLGLGTNYNTKIGIINNYHNWYIGILYTFGIPILCLYFYFFTNIISRLENREILYGLIAILIIGFTETIGLWTGTQVYIFMCLIAQRTIKEEAKQKNDYGIHTNL